jgi:hypothetical protein
MSDDDTDTPDATAVPPAQPFDAFTVVANLLALIADERGCQARLAELKAQIDAAEKAMRKIEHVREAHDRALARDRAEIAAERSDLAQRQVAAERAEASLAETKERIAEFNRAQRSGEEARRFEQLPGGGVRDWGPNGIYRDDAPRPLDDPHYDSPRPSAASDETELEHVAPSASTLTRSVPRPRKTQRRAQPDA